ncbi:hypothetical protein T08_11376 [Trichinella sp. T8]|nr:hypothetical protein T08_11376 [Trichinella sp. T8]
MTRHRRLMNKRRRREYHQRRNPTGIASQSSLLHHLHAHTVLFFEYEDISTYNNFQLANFEDQKNADTDACQSFMSTEIFLKLFINNNQQVEKAKIDNLSKSNLNIEL